MFLVVAATGFELAPLLASMPAGTVPLTLLCGVGPVEASFKLTTFLAALNTLPQGVINIGLAGAYPDLGLALLDLCLAEGETLGDLGIIYEEGIEPLAPSFAPPREFCCDPVLYDRADKILAAAGLPCRSGRFVTVAGVSGTRRRAEILRDGCRAICENMEGAALARVCQGFGVPFLELRCISNLAVDRAEQEWRAEAAARRCGEVAAALLEGLNRDQ